MVQLGVHIGQQNVEMDELRTLWRRLDSAGVDWISVWDHLYEVPPAGGTQPHFEAVATLGALCADTRNARIGCLVFYVGYRNPAHLARIATTLDHISGGRFELGLGSGWAEAEAQAHGYPFPPLRTRMDMVDEAFPLVRAILDQDRTTHRGEFFATTDLSLLPGPVRGHIPMWAGGIGETRTLPLAARHADGWNAPYVSPSEFARLNRLLDARCHDSGRDPCTLERSVNVMFHMTTNARAGRDTVDRLRSQWGDMADRVLDGALLGTPDQAITRLLEYVAAGADGVNVALRAPLDESALVAFLTEVLPAVRAAA